MCVFSNFCGLFRKPELCHNLDTPLLLQKQSWRRQRKKTDLFKKGKGLLRSGFFPKSKQTQPTYPDQIDATFSKYIASLSEYLQIKSDILIHFMR